MSESDAETPTQERPRRPAGEGTSTGKQPRKQTSDNPRRSTEGAARQDSSGDRRPESGQARPDSERDTTSGRGRGESGDASGRSSDDDGGRRDRGSERERRPHGDREGHSDQGPENAHRRPERDDDGHERDDRPRRLGAGRAARMAVRQLAELTTRSIEGVVGVRRDGDSWIVLLEVVEDPRVPSTADIMAEYEVELDGEGELMAYRRRSRYARGHTEED